MKPPPPARLLGFGFRNPSGEDYALLPSELLYLPSIVPGASASKAIATAAKTVVDEGQAKAICPFPPWGVVASLFFCSSLCLVCIGLLVCWFVGLLVCLVCIGLLVCLFLCLFFICWFGCQNKRTPKIVVCNFWFPFYQQNHLGTSFLSCPMATGGLGCGCGNSAFWEGNLGLL